MPSRRFWRRLTRVSESVDQAEDAIDSAVEELETADELYEEDEETAGLELEFAGSDGLEIIDDTDTHNVLLSGDADTYVIEDISAKLHLRGFENDPGDNEDDDRLILSDQLMGEEGASLTLRDSGLDPAELLESCLLNRYLNEIDTDDAEEQAEAEEEAGETALRQAQEIVDFLADSHDNRIKVSLEQIDEGEYLIRFEIYYDSGFVKIHSFPLGEDTLDELKINPDDLGEEWVGNVRIHANDTGSLQVGGEEESYSDGGGPVAPYDIPEIEDDSPPGDTPVTLDTMAYGRMGSSGIEVVLSGNDDGTVTNFEITVLPTNGSLYQFVEEDDEIVLVPVTLDDLIPATVEDDGEGNQQATIWFVPDPDFFGTAMFEYRSIDNADQPAEDEDTAIATVKVATHDEIALKLISYLRAEEVFRFNQDPVASDIAVTVDELTEDNVLADLGLVAPTDPDGDGLTIRVTGLPELGVLTLTGAADVDSGVAEGDELTIEEFEGLEYDAPELDDGDMSFEFTYEVDDGLNGIASATVTIEVIDLDSNHAPVVDDITITVDEGALDTSLGLSEPTDPDGDEFVIRVASLPTEGEGIVTLATVGDVPGAAVEVNQILTLEQFLGLEYDAPEEVEEDTTVEFTYTVNDELEGGITTGTVTINVKDLDDPEEPLGPATITIGDQHKLNLTAAEETIIVENLEAKVQVKDFTIGDDTIVFPISLASGSLDLVVRDGTDLENDDVTELLEAGGAGGAAGVIESFLAASLDNRIKVGLTIDGDSASVDFRLDYDSGFINVHSFAVDVADLPDLGDIGDGFSTNLRMHANDAGTVHGGDAEDTAAALILVGYLASVEAFVFV